MISLLLSIIYIIILYILLSVKIREELRSPLPLFPTSPSTLPSINMSSSSSSIFGMAHSNFSNMLNASCILESFAPCSVLMDSMTLFTNLHANMSHKITSFELDAAGFSEADEM
eukprot:m.69450 g.69450  ORF g.69450 m.69450 type:complete len:114 (-) comp8277_c0_seq1:2165-2506(-)